MPSIRAGAVLGALAAIASAARAGEVGGAPVVYSARGGAWSDPGTWAGRRVPRAGDVVRIKAGHAVTYDVESPRPIRMVHVAGTLEFARDRPTRLDVGLIRIDPRPDAGEDGFHCRTRGPSTAEALLKGPRPALIVGTPDRPIPAGVTATIRLVHFPGADAETLPAIVNCGGRWDVHGAPLSRTWVKLGRTAKPGDDRVTLAEPVTGWRVGDRVIVTVSMNTAFRFRKAGKMDDGGDEDTEERTITAIEGPTLILDRPLAKEHLGSGEFRSEVADLSRNVVIESADPGGVRGHTMYHRGSVGGISYAEFRHLGKAGVLGKYPIHFHLVRGTMRGSGVLGASIWDSDNRWITIHGTDYLLVRDCVGYGSVGHGFFLEDGTEQYNVLDRNLAVQAAYAGPIPGQALPFDDNAGAGFWWANGRNTLTRNVACQNHQYGFRFEVSDQAGFDPRLRLRAPDGATRTTDVRTVPFLRFEANEAHSERSYGFYLGDDKNPSVRGDRRRPFIARDLRAWAVSYPIRANVQFFLADGLSIYNTPYGVYHPDLDAHVYRNVTIREAGRPIGRSHADESIQYGSFTFENVLIEYSDWPGEPAINLACTSPRRGQSGHFRDLSIRSGRPLRGTVVGMSGVRNPRPQNGVALFFHGTPGPGRCRMVLGRAFAGSSAAGDFRAVDGFTGDDVLAADLAEVPFPELLDPTDDLPPATLIRSIGAGRSRLVVEGISQDNGEVASIDVNGRPARIRSAQAGVVDWEAEIDRPADGVVMARAADRAGNVEVTADRVSVK